LWIIIGSQTEPFDDPVAYKGEVIVGLKFVPPDPTQQERDRESGTERGGSSKTKKNWSRGALHVLVKEARNLQTRGKNSGTCDPFCKRYFLLLLLLILNIIYWISSTHIYYIILYYIILFVTLYYIILHYILYIIYILLI